jgi:hypothetical protein
LLNLKIDLDFYTQANLKTRHNLVQIHFLTTNIKDLLTKKTDT